MAGEEQPQAPQLAGDAKLKKVREWLMRAGYPSVDRSNPASRGRVKSGQLLQDEFV